MNNKLNQTIFHALVSTIKGFCITVLEKRKGFYNKCRQIDRFMDCTRLEGAIESTACPRHVSTTRMYGGSLSTFLRLSFPLTLPNATTHVN